MAKPLELNYCPGCGHALIDQFLAGRVRRKCSNCGFVFFRDPKVAAGVLAEQDGKALLVKRLYEPHQGDWALPAGFVEIDEGPVQAALRELTEETGLIGRVCGIVGTYHIRTDPRGPIVMILYHAQIVGGALKAGDDAEEVRFFASEELPPNLAFASTRRALYRWQCLSENTASAGMSAARSS
jgi:ADP-ribose pyrophosphatase YjhB (NUDIX family)